MPTYEYVCKSCGHLFEIVQSMRDDPLTECPQCGGLLRKVFGAPSISFKGSGFYATDHGKKSTKPSGDKKADAGSEASSGGSDSSSRGSDAGAGSDGGSGSGSGSGSASTTDAKPSTGSKNDTSSGDSKRSPTKDADSS